MESNAGVMKAPAHFEGTNEDVVSKTTLNIHSCGLCSQSSLQAWKIRLQNLADPCAGDNSEDKTMG